MQYRAVEEAVYQWVPREASSRYGQQLNARLALEGMHI
jgi:hypothetical protein